MTTWQQMDLPWTFVNGGESRTVKCANCAAELGNERAAAKCTDGKTRFFCARERGTDPQDACFVSWTRRQN